MMTKCGGLIEDKIKRLRNFKYMLSDTSVDQVPIGIEQM